MLSYDSGGRLVSEITKATGRQVEYRWLNTGLLAGATDYAGGASGLTDYGYDREGRITSERYRTYDGTNVVWYRDAAATWDAKGRLVSYRDPGLNRANRGDADYEYDAVGNVRRVGAAWQAPDAAGTGGSEEWYAYDALDRMTVSRGVLVGSRGSGVIARGSSGTDYGWDRAGHRVTETSTIVVPHVVGTWSGNGTGGPIYGDPVAADYRRYYGYTADGWLASRST